MSNISPISGSNRDLWAQAAQASASATTSAPVSGAARAKMEPPTVDSTPDRLPTPSVSLAAIVARMDPVGAKLDQLKAAASGPYTVGDAIVHSGAQFRMNGGHNDAAVRDPKVTSALVHAAARVGLACKVPALQMGRCDPKDLVKVTQALIDDGQLPKSSTEPLADQIHNLQWRFGIGLDCAGYVHQALRAIHGDVAKLGLRSAGNEDFTGLAANPHFKNVGPAAARPGDVIVLQGHGGGDPGHNLIVRAHATIDSPDASAVARWPGAAQFIAGKGAGTIHLLEVDSSFGAENGRPDGGVRRDVLLWNDATKAWLTCKDIPRPEATHPDVVRGTPYGERAVTGVFRSKGGT